MDRFVNLHVHGDQGSLLDGAQSARQIAERTAKLGQPGVALTDHGTMYGSFDFHQECIKAGVTPILGLEAYLAPTEVAVREAVYLSGEKQPAEISRGAYSHMTLLAKNETGLRNLFRLVSLSYDKDKFYYKPRMDLAMLREHSEGLIATTGCAGGHVPSALRLGLYNQATNWAADLRTIFKDDLFVELMDHGITEEEGSDLDEREMNTRLISLANLLDLPLLGTNDAHYCGPEDSHTHDALLCLNTKSRISDENRFRFSGSGYHLKSRAEMDLLPLPQAALDNTLEVLSRMEGYGKIFDKKTIFPSGFEGKDLKTEVFAGIEARLDVPEAPDEYYQAAVEQVKVITDSGFTDYFYVMQDLLLWARDNNILVGPGRGSAGGSIVSWALGITDIDPIKYGLFAERFMNPERVALPDIDVDISDYDRPRVLEHLKERWGNENVAQIMTLGTIGAKAALKDASRVLGHPYSKGEELVKLLPDSGFGQMTPLSKMPAVHSAEDREILALARNFEGLTRSAGGHASGVVLSPVPISDLMPTWKTDTSPLTMTGWTANPTEHIGLVKMDLLGLRNLGVIQETLTLIDKDIPWLKSLDTTDKEAFALMASGWTDGVFQLDSDGMKRLLKSVKVSSFDDVAACLALYRPGPMGSGSHEEYARRKNKAGARKTPDVHHEINDVLEPILRTTFGLIVYQEQMMKVLQVLCSWSLGKADLVRKAMGKKDHAALEKLKPEMRSSMEGNGYSADAFQALWDVLLPFADYAFNLSHSVGYGIVSYWTAYLKAHYPVEYMASLLSSVMGNPDKLPIYLQEAVRMGIRILPPDINKSKGRFSVDGLEIRFGLAAVKGVGENSYDSVAEGAPYSSMTDYMTRAHTNGINVGVLRALVQSGAMDTLIDSRTEVDKALEDWVERESYRRKRDEPTLLPPSYEAPKAAEGDSIELYREWEVGTLGVAITSGRIVLTPEHNLSEQEWDYLASVLVQTPGSAPVYMVIGNREIATGESCDPAWLRDRIRSITLVSMTNSSISRLGG